LESVRCVTSRDCTDNAGSYMVRNATASKKAMKIGLGWCRKDVEWIIIVTGSTENAIDS